MLDWAGKGCWLGKKATKQSTGRGRGTEEEEVRGFAAGGRPEEEDGWVLAGVVDAGAGQGSS